MRGKVVSDVPEFVIVGITPACAGKRVRGTPDSINDKDHPRVCGEKYLRRKHSTGSAGSPPRVRGKVPA